MGFGPDVDASGVEVGGRQLRREGGLGACVFRLAWGHGHLHNRGDRHCSGRGSGGIEALFQTGSGHSLSPLMAPQAPGTSLTNGHKAPLVWTASHDPLRPKEYSADRGLVPSRWTAAQQCKGLTKTYGRCAELGVSITVIAPTSLPPLRVVPGGTP